MKANERSGGVVRSADSLWHRTVNWENLRAVGCSRLASITVLMPFIGYAIIYNERVTSFLFEIGIGLSDIHPDMPVASQSVSSGALSGLERLFRLEIITQLNLLYMGAVLIGLGTILFRVFAPKTVQKYVSIEAFCNSELERASARRLRTMTFTIAHRRPNVAKDLVAYAPWLNRETHSLTIAYAELRQEGDLQIHSDVLSSFFNVESRYFNRFAAYLVSGLYFLGFCLAAILGMFFTLRVLISVIS